MSEHAPLTSPLPSPLSMYSCRLALSRLREQTAPIQVGNVSDTSPNLGAMRPCNPSPQIYAPLVDNDIWRYIGEQGGDCLDPVLHKMTEMLCRVCVCVRACVCGGGGGLHKALLVGSASLWRRLLASRP